jgi:hypothetical protein
MAGEWKANMEKSDFGPMPAPPDLTMKIKIEKDKALVTQVAGGETTEFKVSTTPGEESVNELPDGAKMTSKFQYEGDIQVSEIKISGAGYELVFKDRISVSADKKVMTVDRAATGPQGDFKVKLVFDRQ